MFAVITYATHQTCRAQISIASPPPGIPRTYGVREIPAWSPFPPENNKQYFNQCGTRTARDSRCTLHADGMEIDDYHITRVEIS